MEDLFGTAFGAGPCVRHTVVAKVAHMSGRSVFSSLGGLGMVAAASDDCTADFKFARGRIFSTVRRCNLSNRGSAMGG